LLNKKGEPMSTSYSVIAPDGQMYGPVDEMGLGQWVREGRVDARSVLFCHATNARVAAASIPSLQPLLGLSPQQVAQLLQPAAAPTAPMTPAYAPPPPGVMPYAQPAGFAPRPPYGYAAEAPAHQLNAFPAFGAVLLSMFVPFFSLIFYGIAHGQLPRRRPDDPSTGRAIGFMFIPFFNIYWTCFFWVRLCTRINDELARAGQPPAAPRALIITMLWMMLGMFIPLLNILVMIALGVMSIVFIALLQSSINTLVRATRTYPR
jgi:hypothetical protein